MIKFCAIYFEKLLNIVDGGVVVQRAFSICPGRLSFGSECTIRTGPIEEPRAHLVNPRVDCSGAPDGTVSAKVPPVRTSKRGTDGSPSESRVGPRRRYRDNRRGGVSETFASGFAAVSGHRMASEIVCRVTRAFRIKRRARGETSYHRIPSPPPAARRCRS